MRHRHMVLSVTFSPDGKTVLTGSGDEERNRFDHRDLDLDPAQKREGEARLWDAATGNPLGPPMPHADPVLGVAFSPDGNYIVSRSGNEVCVWDTATHTAVSGTLRHSNRILAMAWSPDSKMVLTGGADKTVRLWNAATGKLHRELPHPALIQAVAFSPDGKKFLVGYWAGPEGEEGAQLWDAATGQPIGGKLHQPGTLCVAFSPDGKSCLTGGGTVYILSEGSAQVWDADTGKPKGEPLLHAGPIVAADYSRDGKKILAVNEFYLYSGKGDVGLWDAATHKSYGQLLQHPGTVSGAAISPDGLAVISWAPDGLARLWEVSHDDHFTKPILRDRGPAGNGPQKLEIQRFAPAAVLPPGAGPATPVPPQPHDSQVVDISFSPTGKTILEVAGDQTARLRDLDTGKVIGQPIMVGRGRHDPAAVFSPDGRTILTTGDRTNLRLWDATTSRKIWEQPEPADGRPAVDALFEGFTMTFSPDGKRIMTSKRGNGGFLEARLWNATTGEAIGEPMPHFGHHLLSPELRRSALFSPEGRLLLTVNTNEKGTDVRRWEAATGRPSGQPVLLPVSAFAAFSPDGDSLLTVGEDGAGRLWAADGGALRRDFGNLGGPNEFKAAAFNSDGSVLLVQGPLQVRLWRVATGEPIGAPARGVLRATFSPDGKTLLTGNLVGFRLWDATTSELIGQAQHQEVFDELLTVFSPDGRSLLSVGAKEPVRLWDTATAKPVGLSPAQSAHLQFGPSGEILFNDNQQKTTWVQRVPAALEGDTERIIRWVQLMTGMELNSNGAVVELDEAAWRQCYERLHALGGPLRQPFSMRPPPRKPPQSFFREPDE